MDATRFERLKRGRDGEAAAERHLERLGCRCLERCARARTGEIDLVMLDGRTVVFVEVKARGSAGFMPPEAAVDSRKRARLVKTALAYLQRKGFPDGTPVRFDVVAICGGQVRHIPDAFTAEGYTR